MRRILLSCTLLCISLTPLWGQSELQPEIYLDRTAFFVGEPIRYQVRVRHDPKIEFVTDRLDKANLEMTPFKVQDLTVERRRQGDLNLLIVTLQLVTYEIAQKEWKIPPFNLYYVSHNSPTPAEGNPVRLLTVPPVPVAFRSSLPEESRRIRDEITFKNFTGSLWTFFSLGLLGFLVMGALGANVVYQRLHRPEPEREERSAIEKRASQAVGQLLAAHQQEKSPASTLVFYRDMAAILRDYSAKVSEKSGLSLTSLEIREALARAGEDSERARRVAELVALGDQVRYAKEGAQLGTDRLEGVRSELSQLFRN